MIVDPTTTFDLAEANHQARVLAATFRQASADAAADRDWLRRTKRPSLWRLARRT